MFNNFKIKFENEITYPQFKEVVKFLGDAKGKIIIGGGISFMYYHGEKGDFVIKIDFYKMTITISII